MPNRARSRRAQGCPWVRYPRKATIFSLSLYRKGFSPKNHPDTPQFLLIAASSVVTTVVTSCGLVLGHERTCAVAMHRCSRLGTALPRSTGRSLAGRCSAPALWDIAPPMRTEALLGTLLIFAAIRGYDLEGQKPDHYTLLWSLVSFGQR